MTQPGKPARKRRRIPVTSLLVALIVAVALPSLVFSALLLLQSDRFARAQGVNRAAQWVDRLGDSMDRELRGMVNTLTLVHASGWLETEAYGELHRSATEALAGTDTYLIAVDADGRQILNTRLPWGAPLNGTSDMPSLRRALQSGAPVASDVFFGAVAQADVFNIVAPIQTQRTQARALILTRNTDTLHKLFDDAPPPAGWHYAVLDGAGKVAAGEEPINGSVSLLQRLCLGAERERVNEGGADFSSAAQALAPWGWRVCAWSSSDEIEAEISQGWRAFVLITLAVVAASIAGGALLGRLLTGGIRRAANVARVLDGGGETPEQHSIIREVDDVLGVLTRAAQRRLAAEQNLQLLQRETAHRAKNQLAIAAALTRLSARSATDVATLRDDITGRLAALGRSIDMMATRPGAEVAVRELVAGQMEPFVAGHEGRLELAGEEVLVSPVTAQSLGLVLHEKATNASKYGSWSEPQGRVEVAWRVEGKDLVLVWTERGGPPASAPARSGFGTSLVEMLIERNLGGSVTRDYGASGLVATFRMPMEQPGG